MDGASDLHHYQNVADRWDGTQSLASWRKLSTTTLAVDGGGRDLTESTIDLSADLHGPTGHLLVVVSPTRRFDSAGSLYWQNRPTITWVQATSIGVDAP